MVKDIIAPIVLNFKLDCFYFITMFNLKMVTNYFINFNFTIFDDYFNLLSRNCFIVFNQ
jgi:hypothetical protein